MGLTSAGLIYPMDRPHGEAEIVPAQGQDSAGRCDSRGVAEVAATRRIAPRDYPAPGSRPPTRWLARETRPGARGGGADRRRRDDRRWAELRRPPVERRWGAAAGRTPEG